MHTETEKDTATETDTDTPHLLYLVLQLDPNPDQCHVQCVSSLCQTVFVPLTCVRFAFFVSL